MKRAAMSRMRSITAYAALPGQSVLPTSRWVKIVGSVGVAPRGKWVNEPPAEVSTTVPRGSTRSKPSRQPSSRPVVRNWIGVGGTTSKLPIIATPQVFWLKPPVCEPSTGLSMPPARPSKTWPYLSTIAL